MNNIVIKKIKYSMRKVLLLCILILCGCVDNSQIINARKDIDSSVKTEISDVRSDYEDGCEIEILNYESNDSFSVMKNCLTKEEIQLVRDVERKFNKRLFENAEYAVEEYTESLEDFQKYTSIALKAFNEVLKIHGYKMPEEVAFYKKIKDIYGEDYHDFFKSTDFLSPVIDFESVNEDYHVLEFASKLSLKYRMAWFGGYSNSRVFSFKKRILSKDTFGLEYERFDENSDIVLDIKNLKFNICANLYIFNESKAAKVWLMTNNMDFFNYINCWEDREVNEKKLKKYLNSVPDDYETYDVNKDRSLVGYLWQGQDIFNLVLEKTDSAIIAYEEDKSRKLDIKAFDLLFMYLDKCRTLKHKRTDANFVKLICNFAKIEVSLNKKHANKEKHGYFNFVCQSRASSLFDKELLELAKKEHYFNIDSFDEVLKVIEWDKGDHHNFENTYPGGCIPFDYSTLVQ